MNADIRHVDCDVIVLKYAQRYYGADAAVKRALEPTIPKSAFQPSPGAFSIIASAGRVKAPNAIFVGTVPLREFDYAVIREFASRSLAIIGRELPHATRVAMTVHGVGFGLDERECFLAQLAGLDDALHADAAPVDLRLLMFVEAEPPRAQRLKHLLKESAFQRYAQSRACGTTSKRWTEVGVQSACFCRYAVF